MKKGLVLSCVLSLPIGARDITDATLKEMTTCYLNQVPTLIADNEQEQETYRFLYSKFLEQLSMMSDARRKKKLQSMYKWSAKTLKEKHLSYYRALQSQGQFDPETQTRETRVLLTRYALYEKMHTVKDINWQEVKEVVGTYGKRAAATVSKATKSLKQWLLS